MTVNRFMPIILVQYNIAYRDKE
ncbi:hypothetical protein KL86CLO1_12203 [uncultured Eubacteriales bacterium]|uniref:Uncharacterized protein n=1 Tax=uncultured Eubacteriales bacterium TaxID=172733 RepID=A0A212K5H1_9FIRM|nr:hypothetical protein KL86CLO1_12203 [uncultured Eubacteriales bacterium]